MSTLCVQLLQFYANHFETLQVFLSWSEDVHVVWIQSLEWFLSLFPHFELQSFFRLKYYQSVQIVGTLCVQLRNDITILASYHRHDITTLASYHWHDITTLASHHWHDITTLASYHRHDITTLASYHWHDITTLASYHWHDITTLASYHRHDITILVS